mmetsp:Transcript_10743/g.23100  ORF Transcript_10743/g.23100 Transcript_10743/m.23100 type:complete len:80 (-) Transcript_10743:551-790(-)
MSVYNKGHDTGSLHQCSLQSMSVHGGQPSGMCCTGCWCSYGHIPAAESEAGSSSAQLVGLSANPNCSGPPLHGLVLALG